MPSDRNPELPSLPASEVKRIRAKLGLSQSDMAKHLGYPTGHMVSHWESGRKYCSGPAAQILRLYDRSNGKAMQWAFIHFEPAASNIRKGNNT